MPTASSVIGRLAPSPTGAQHLGNARTFLVAWLSNRLQGGHLILRMEDIDSPRIKPWAAQQAIDDLRWLGLDWDEGPEDLAASRFVQSNRLELYYVGLQELKLAEAIYPCTCSRSDIENAASAPHAKEEWAEGAKYGRRCFTHSVADSDRLTEPFAWRFRTTASTIEFNDLYRGRLATNVQRALGDFVVFKNNNSPAYQLSVVIDDHEMGVTEVIRGDDLIPSTFRQLELYRFFGWKVPRFGHPPLVVGQDGRRLAKRHGDTRLSYFREKGVPPERIIGLLAHSLGWSESLQKWSPADLLTHFSNSSSDNRDLHGGNPLISPLKPWTFGPEHLAWLLSGQNA